jgi:uracil-DNA glycosylase
MNVLESVKTRVDHSWQADVLKGLSLMDKTYLNECEQHPNWLPSLDCLFSAFSIEKTKVRYVLLGESPYPRAESANGYAFWDANVHEIWSAKGLSVSVNRATSLRNFIKMLLHADGKLAKPFSAEDIQTLNKQDSIQTLDDLFKKLINNGFLLLNASLIWSSEKPVRYHAKHWKPFIDFIVNQLRDRNVHFLLFGKIAQQFKQLPIEKCLIAEHPYVLSFIENQDVLNFFKPFYLLRASLS